MNELEEFHLALYYAKMECQLNLPEEWMKKQIKGISKFTIGMKELLSPDHLSLLGISDEIINICSPYFILLGGCLHPPIFPTESVVVFLN